MCLLLVGPSEQCERSEPASLRVAGGDEPERERGDGEGVSVRVLWVDFSYTFNVYVRLVHQCITSLRYAPSEHLVPISPVELFLVHALRRQRRLYAILVFRRCTYVAKTMSQIND